MPSIFDELGVTSPGEEEGDIFSELGASAPDEAEPSVAEPSGPQPVAYNRGWGGDLGSSLARSGVDAVRKVGGGLAEAGVDTGQKLYDWAEEVPGKHDILKPDQGEAQGTDSFFRKGVMSGVRSLLPSAVPLGAAAVGALAGPYVAGAAGLSALGLTFFGGTYHEKKAELDQNTALSEEEKHVAARDYAAIESGGELVSDIIVGLTAGIGKATGIGPAAGGLTKTALRQLLSLSSKEVAKNIALKQFPMEWATETAQGKFQSDIDARTGVGEKMSWLEAAAETAIPVAVMTLTFGLAANAYSANERRKVKEDLNALNPDGTFDNNRRMKAVGRIYSEIPDQKFAEAWKFHALNAVQTGERFNLDDNILEQATGKLDAANRVSEADEKFFELIKRHNPADTDLERLQAAGRYTKQIDDYILRRGEDEEWAGKVINDPKLHADPVKVARAMKILERQEKRTGRETELQQRKAFSGIERVQDQTADLVDSIVQNVQSTIYRREANQTGKQEPTQRQFEGEVERQQYDEYAPHPPRAAAPAKKAKKQEPAAVGPQETIDPETGDIQRSNADPKIVAEVKGIVERIDQATPEQIAAYSGVLDERFAARPELKPFESVIRQAIAARESNITQEAIDGISRDEVSEGEGGGRGSEAETVVGTGGTGSVGEGDQAGLVGPGRIAGPEQVAATGSRPATETAGEAEGEGRIQGQPVQPEGTDQEAGTKLDAGDVELEQQGTPSPVGSEGRQVPTSPAVPASDEIAPSDASASKRTTEGTTPPAVSTEGAGRVETSAPASKEAWKMTREEFRRREFNEEDDRMLPSDYFGDSPLVADLKDYPSVVGEKGDYELRSGYGPMQGYFVATSGGKIVAYADNGAIMVEPEHQRKGIGLALSKLLRKANSNYRIKSHTAAGGALMMAVHRDAVLNAVTEGKPVPAKVLAEYPDLQPPAPVSKGAENEKGAAQPPIVKYRKEAEGIEAKLPPVQEGFVRLWRGGRPGETGKVTSFTNDIAGIALPFRDFYGGELSYVDVNANDLSKYENKVGAAPEAEFNLPPEIASRAKAIAPPADSIPGPTPGEKSPTLAELRAKRSASTDMAERKALTEQIKQAQAELAKGGRKAKKEATQAVWAAENATGGKFRKEEPAKPSGFDNSSETSYSTSEGTGEDFQYHDMGEDTSEQAQKDNAKLRAIFTPYTGSGVANSIKVARVSGTVRNFADRITEIFGRRAVFHRAAPGAGLPNGLIDRNDPGTIYVNVDSGFAPSTIIGHETLHAMRKERPDLYRALLRAANRNIKIEVFNAYRAKLKRNKFLQGRDISQDYVVEEMLADYLGDQFSKPAFWESLAEQRPGLFKRLVNFVKAFLDDLITRLKVDKNFGSDRFFKDAAKMRAAIVKATGEYGGAVAGEAVTPMDIRFAAREAAKALGMGAGEFRSWFGDSKVVSKNGAPLRVYHGSKADFKRFDVSGDGEEEIGAFFTTHPEVANEYAGDAHIENGMVYPAYLSIQNPYEVTNEQWSFSKGLSPAEAKAQGHDGYIIRGMNRGSDKADTYIIFSANQAKSAIGNSGQFSPSTDDIRYSAPAPGKPESTVSKFNEETGKKLTYNGFQQYGSDGFYLVTDETPGPTYGATFAVQNMTVPALKEAYRKKNADFGGPDVAFSLADEVRDSIGPAISEAFDVPQKKSLGATIKNAFHPGRITNESIQEAKDIARTKLIDKLHPIRTLGDIPYKLHSLLGNTHAIFSTFLQHGKLSWQDDALTVTSKDTGFLPWFHKLGEDGRKLFYWMAVKRAEVLEGEGRENWLTPEKRGAILSELFTGLTAQERTAKEAQFKQWNKEFQEWNKNTIDVAIQAGLITEEQRASWTSEFYLPFYRIMEDEATREEFLQGPMKSKKHISAQIKRLKGGEEKIGDPLENVLKNWFHLIQESQRNVARANAAEVAQNLGLAEEVPRSELLKIVGSQNKTRWGIKRIGGSRVSQYFETEAEARAELEEGFEIVHQKTSSVIFGRKEDFNILSYQKDGKQVYLRVEDRMLYDALADIQAKAFDSKIFQVMTGAKRLLTAGATFTPAFRIANMIRDTVHSFVVAKSFMPFIDTAKGIMKVWRESPEYVALMASGGGFGQGWIESGDPKAMTRAIDKIISREGTARGNILDTPRRMLDFWQRVGMASEMAARVQLYSNLREKGESHLEAAFRARDLLDFFKSGSGKSVRVIMATTPFLNARIQGLDRLYRGAKEDPKAFFTKGAMVSAASLMLWLAFSDDDRYKELEDWEKWQYHHFWIGDQHFRIPKAFETGAIFSSLFESIGNVAAGNEDMDFFLRFLKHTLTETFALNVPVIFGPSLEVYANKSAFTGRPIESYGQQRLPAGERANPWTPELLKDLGKGLNISPLKMETIIRGHTAAFGTIFLTVGDAMYRTALDSAPRPAMTMQDVPGYGRFVRDKDGRTKYATRYYDFANEVQDMVATVNNYKALGEFEKARDFSVNNRDKLKYKKFVGKMQGTITNIRKREKMVWGDRTMNPEEKREAMRELTRRKNELFKRAYEVVYE